MSDLQKYIKNRTKKDKPFAEGFEEGYRDFKIGVLLLQARKDAGFTQEQVAKKLHTQKTAISRLERHADDIRLSTLENYAKALGKKVFIKIG